MAVIIGSQNLGVDGSSLRLQSRVDSPASLNGNPGQQIYVNAATGNLVVQRHDELLLGRGPDIDVLHTYNSQAQFDGDNNDNWQIGFYRQLRTLVGAVNAAGSSLVRVDADGRQTSYRWDSASGKYLSHEGAGSTDILAYDSTRSTWAWTDGDTRVTETYDWNGSAGRLLTEADTSGNTIAYVYNGNLLASVTDASGERTVLVYNGNNLAQVRTETLLATGAIASSIRVRYGYDASNRLSRVIVDLSPDDSSIADGKTYETSFTYAGSSTRIMTLTQGDGSALAFDYDPSGRVIRITDALGEQSNYSYDMALRITTVTDALGYASTYEYDASGRLTRITTPAVNGISQVRSFIYNANGDITGSTDGNGNAATMEYDANGNLTLLRDAMGNTTVRSYDAQNQLRSETRYLTPDPDGAGSAQPARPLTSRYVYDTEAKGRMRFFISAEGSVTENRYNDYGQVVSTIDYAGNFYTGTANDEASLNGWVATADKTRSRRTDFTYDFRGQMSASKTWTTLDSAGNGLEAGMATTAYVYDAAGRLLQTIAPLGAVQTSSYTYDGSGRLLTATDSLGQRTEYQYVDAPDNAGLSTSMQIDDNGLRTIRSYDRAGRLVSVQQGTAARLDLGTTRYYYDAVGQLRMSQNPNSARTWLFYDAAGRKVGELDGTGALTEYLYNANDQLTQSIRYSQPAVTSGLIVIESGPSAGALALGLSAVRPATDAVLNQCSWNAYDNAGRLVKTVDAEGNVVETRYDGDSRVVQLTRYINPIRTSELGSQPRADSIAPTPDAALDRVTRNFYDNDGRLRGMLDAEGYLTEVRYDASGQEIQRIGYANATDAGLRASGTLAQLTPASSKNDITRWRFYDAREQLVAEIDGENYLTEHQYDLDGNHIRSRRYANRVSAAIGSGVAIAGLRPASNAADQIQSWTYDALGRVASEIDFEDTQTSYRYDSAGNVISATAAANTSQARTRSNTYDLEGQLLTETDGRGFVTSYQYDKGGNRISATDANGYRSLYYYDDDGQLVYTINALGEVQGHEFNGLGLAVSSTAYGGRIAAATLASLNGGVVTVTLRNAIAAIANPATDSKATYAYTPGGRLAYSIAGDMAGNAASNGIINNGDFDPTQFGFDAAGNIAGGAVGYTAGKSRKNRAVILLDNSIESLNSAQGLYNKHPTRTAVYHQTLNENGSIDFNILYGKSRNFNNAELSLVGHGGDVDGFTTKLDSLAAKLKERGVTGLREAAVIACNAASDVDGESLVNAAFEGFKRNDLATSVSGHTGRIKVDPSGRQVLDSIESKKITLLSGRNGVVIENWARSAQIEVMEGGWLGKNKRPAFNSQAKKAIAAAKEILPNTLFDFAHRLSYHDINKIMRGNNPVLKRRMIRALTIPQRNFGSIKKDYQDFFKFVIKVKDLDKQICLLNSSIFNLRPGNRSINRSIGAKLDACKVKGAMTPQTRALSGFSSDPGRANARSSDVMTPQQKLKFEAKVSKNFMKFNGFVL